MSELKIGQLASSAFEGLDRERLRRSLASKQTVVAKADEPAIEVAKRLGATAGALVVVALVLGQYLTCFEALRARHIEHRHGKWFWLIEIEDEGGQKRTERVPVESFRESEDAPAATA